MRFRAWPSAAIAKSLARADSVAAVLTTRPSLFRKAFGFRNHGPDDAHDGIVGQQRGRRPAGANEWNAGDANDAAPECVY